MTQTEEHMNHIHKNIALALRKARILSGMSQQELGKQAGITYQQIQKYENGKSRITAARLLQILTILNISCQDFLPDLLTTKAKAAEYQPDDTTLKICRRLMTINDPEQKKRIADAVFLLTAD